MKRINLLKEMGNYGGRVDYKPGKTNKYLSIAGAAALGLSLIGAPEFLDTYKPDTAKHASQKSTAKGLIGLPFTDLLKMSKAWGEEKKGIVVHVAPEYKVKGGNYDPGNLPEKIAAILNNKGIPIIEFPEDSAENMIILRLSIGYLPFDRELDMKPYEPKDSVTLIVEYLDGGRKHTKTYPKVPRMYFNDEFLNQVGDDMRDYLKDLETIRETFKRREYKSSARKNISSPQDNPKFDQSPEEIVIDGKRIPKSGLTKCFLIPQAREGLNNPETKEYWIEKLKKEGIAIDRRDNSAYLYPR